MIEVSVVIVNYNTCELLENCLDSIIKHTRDITYELIVVDNASIDNSVSMVQASFPQVKLIALQENIGFSKGNNVAFKYINGKYVFLLNSDTLFVNNALKLFYDYMERKENHDVGAVGTWLRDEQLQVISSCGRFPLRRKYLYNYVRRIFGLMHQSINGGYDALTECDVEYVIGADLFLRSEIIQSLGGFNPQFFVYYEETELQYRMMKKGYKRRIISEPIIIHLEGKSTRLKITRKIMEDRSKVLYFTILNGKWNNQVYKYLNLVFEIMVLTRQRYSFKEIIQYYKAYLRF